MIDSDLSADAERAPKREEIALRAYEKYLSRNGGSDGDALSDWLEAERELVESQRPNQMLTTKTAARRPRIVT